MLVTKGLLGALRRPRAKFRLELKTRLGDSFPVGNIPKMRATYIPYVVVA